MRIAWNQHRNASPSSGYTLYELLLVTGLLMLLSSAAIFSLATLDQSSTLNQGADRFESLLRLARAEAANTGRRVRISFVQESSVQTNLLSRVEVSWEPQPLEEPEVFANLGRVNWGIEEVNANVGIETVKVSDPEAQSDPSEAAGDDLDLEPEPVDAESGGQPQPITFNPDGSCDSAEIVLAARDLESDQRVRVRIEGLTGTVSSMVTTNGVPGDFGEGLEAAPDFNLQPAQ